MNINPKTAQLIQDVTITRSEFIALADNINETDAAFKPAANEWGITDIAEHLFWAEQGALYGMWKILHAIRNG